MKLTYHIVLSFEQGRRPSALIPDQPREVPSERAAILMAERLRTMKAGVVAFAREGDPETGDWEDARVLVSYGRVPIELISAPY